MAQITKEQLKIRQNAFKLMRFLYVNCKSSLHISNLDCSSLFANGKIAPDFHAAGYYLVDSGYIKACGEISTKSITCDVTAKGIDWVEDQYGIGINLD